MKRFVFAFLAIAVLALGSGSALAAPPSEEIVGFVLTAASCPNLPTGTVITGTGTSTTVEIVKTDGNRVTTVTNTTHASATSKNHVAGVPQILPNDANVPFDGPDGTRTSVESVHRRCCRPLRLPHHPCGTSRLFLRNGLLDPRASPERLRHLIPEKLPSNRPSLVFQFGQR